MKNVLDKDFILNNSKIYEKIIGIYFLIYKDKIVYIGQSRNILQRINQHNIKNKFNFDKVHYVECSENELDKLESVYINKFKPEYNAETPADLSDTLKNSNGKNLIINIKTISQLFSIDTDSTTLFLFYVKNSVMQKTNIIYSTDSFCRKGLRWGKSRFSKAKRILLDYKFIEPFIRRDTKGVIDKHYIKINNYPLPSYLLTLKTTSGEQETNACNILKRNACNIIKDKNEIFTKVNISDDVIEIIDHWNKSVDKIRFCLSDFVVKKDFPIKHKKPTTKCTVSFSTSGIVSFPLNEILSDYLKTDTKEALLKAITNYTELFISNVLGKDEYYYTTVWKTLGQFVYSGIHNNTGYKSLLDLDKLKKGYNSNISDIDKLRNNFTPITTVWDNNKILDKSRNTYYGFETSELRNFEVIDSDIRDLLDFINSNEVLSLYGYFNKLERCISSLLFNRKSNGIDVKLLLTLMKMWDIEKDRWKKIAKSIRGG